MVAKVGLRRIGHILIASGCLKCPRCTRGPLFYGLFKMHPECPQCYLKYEREQGFFVGAIYLNYAATVAIMIPGYFLLYYYTEISLAQQLILWSVFAIFFPLLFFRHSRSLWLGLVYILSPDEEPRRHLRRVV